jgi:hypothetical protein
MLDDAIREHLELKRRRGADPDEVAREQREALEPIPGLAPPPDGATADDSSNLGAEEVSSTPLVDPATPAGVEQTPDAPVGGSAMSTGQATGIAGAEETAELDMSTVLGEEPTDSAAGAAPSTEPDGADPGSLEWEVPADEAAQGAEPEQPDEDVLEETPDFLRETPEQERLWFEQRPPRDFDFDR